MFKRVLIANRGEIAVRIIRACQELDIETVAVYSAADANALHVQLADMACPIGPADASESYLNMAAILEAAKSSGADAIHPGYGFLSENADFAEQVTAAGMTWIGPLAETIRQVGDKDIARAAMVPSGIPMAKGSEPLTSNEMALTAARETGYPVILKPVAGGGGKGMFVAHQEEDLKNILQLADVTKTKFYFEHYIERSRHIEVQIVADNFGTVLHLGERECSLQRRNQKLLEEEIEHLNKQGATMVIMGEQYGANGRTVALIHSSRILLVVLTLPFFVQFVSGVSLAVPRSGGASVFSTPWQSHAFLIGTGLAGVLAGRLLRLRAKYLLGPMLISFLNSQVEYTRAPDQHHAIAPYGLFPCADGKRVLLAVGCVAVGPAAPRRRRLQRRDVPRDRRPRRAVAVAHA